MSDENRMQSQHARDGTVGSVPLDIVAGWGLLATAYLAGVLSLGTPVRLVLAAPVVFFLPGYVTVSAAFPHRATAPELRYPTRISIGERFALSVGLSLVVVPLLGLFVALFPGGFTEQIVAGLLGVYIVGGGVVAGVRRLHVPAEHRFRVPIGRWVGRLVGSLRHGSIGERAVTLALCLSIVSTAAAAGFVLAVPADGESFTDLHLVTETDDGDLVADGYPTNLTEGQPATYTAGIENHEGITTDYVVVVTLDRVTEIEGAQRTVESNELARFDATVAAGDRWTRSHTVTPEMTGEGLRLTYHLYIDTAPETADRDSAYRTVHVWVDVAPADA